VFYCPTLNPSPSSGRDHGLKGSLHLSLGPLPWTIYSILYAVHFSPCNPDVLFLVFLCGLFDLWVWVVCSLHSVTTGSAKNPPLLGILYPTEHNISISSVGQLHVSPCSTHTFLSCLPARNDGVGQSRGGGAAARSSASMSRG
ncbi:unnamed protein product, partial [Sphacelaria rigidula]